MTVFDRTNEKMFHRSRGESFFQSFINPDRADLLSEFRPTAQYFGIFQGGAASLFGFPITQQIIFAAGLSIAIKQIAAVTAGREGRNQGSHGPEQGLSLLRQ